MKANIIKLRHFLFRFAAIFVIICTSAVIFFMIYKKSIVEYLSLSKPENATLLIVEGWVDDRILDFAVKEYNGRAYTSVLVTGMPIDSSFTLYTEGIIEYSIKEQELVLHPGEPLRLSMKGTSAGGIKPLSSVHLNGQIVKQLTVESDWNKFEIFVDSAVHVHTIGVSFDNDGYTQTEDRNLHIKSIQVNEQVFPARSENAFVLQKKGHTYQNPQSTNYHSMAAIGANKLVNLGISKEEVIALPSPLSNRNKTYLSAYTINEWLSSSQHSGQDINIISEGIHSRRSYILYQRALKKQNINIGILPANVEGEQYRGNTLTDKDIIRELIGSFYYRFLFRPGLN